MIRKKSKSQEFAEEEARLKEPCQEMFEEIRQLIENNQVEQAREKLHSMPFDVFEYALDKYDPPNKVRDYLNALVRWGFAACDANQSSWFSERMRRLEKQLQKKRQQTCLS